MINPIDMVYGGQLVPRENVQQVINAVRDALDLESKLNDGDVGVVDIIRGIDLTNIGIFHETKSPTERLMEMLKDSQDQEWLRMQERIKEIESLGSDPYKQEKYHYPHKHEKHEAFIPLNKPREKIPLFSENKRDWQDTPLDVNPLLKFDSMTGYSAFIIAQKDGSSVSYTLFQYRPSETTLTKIQDTLCVKGSYLYEDIYAKTVPKFVGYSNGMVVILPGRIVLAEGKQGAKQLVHDLCRTESFRQQVVGPFERLVYFGNIGYAQVKSKNG